MAAYHWGEPGRTTSLDGETHLRPMWHRRSRSDQDRTRQSLVEWFDKYTRALPIHELIAKQSGCQVHTIRKGQPVDYSRLMRLVVGRSPRKSWCRTRTCSTVTKSVA